MGLIETRMGPSGGALPRAGDTRGSSIDDDVLGRTAVLEAYTVVPAPRTTLEPWLELRKARTRSKLEGDPDGRKAAHDHTWATTAQGPRLHSQLSVSHAWRFAASLQHMRRAAP